MVSETNKALFEFFASFELLNIATSIATNLLLVYIILHGSQEIGAYRYLLLAFALYDIYFPIVHFLTLPVICSYKDAFIMFSHGVFTSRVSICLFACSFSQTMPIMCHLFLYRLVATKWPSNIRYYTRRSCCTMVMVTVFVESSLWFLNCYFNYGPDSETEEYVQPFLVDEFIEDGMEFIGALYYNDEGKFRTRAFLATMGFNTIMSVCMSVILVCSFTIVFHFRSATAKWSRKTKTMQLQLFRTLVAQTTIPMIFVYFPCAGIINLPMLGFRLNVFPNLVSASLTLFPLIDAFIITFGVRSYRRTVLLLFIRSVPNMITAGAMSNAQT